ncbi:Xaa-Pro aminopeptidase [Sphingomonas sp. PP-F2F-G114-C0414]|uniref:M24 family metallopeptidase n=1 Tax=Sphingomonas sp. PP-F2F-G114-C0414 TaxID=2135662 RepID=UPI000EF8C8E9|nr:Xaa-Pro peptidase family protein [Sphingomonas sp. PP-F2F-G114-C0414]RMB28600.1 Xaa-Pro aminopeptidase [Sphingomonas sp. PP-F2F-G114-C0414]
MSTARHKPAFSPSRRDLLSLAIAAPWLSTSAILRAAEPDLSALSDITGMTRPIDATERAARLFRAQSLMKAAGIGAVLIEPGSSMIYFTGVRWHTSERLTLAILPAEGEPCIVTPFFEEPSVRETLAVPAEVRVWQEDENPLAVVAGFLRDRKLVARPVGLEAEVRYFAYAGLARVLPDAKIVSADPVVRACRMIKTSAEIALMQAATEVTLAAYRWTKPRVEKGMTGPEIGALMNAATKKLGGAPEFALALIGEASAYPHGSREIHRVADGQVVLMDCGCTVQGYQSDISRTWVHGTATADQRKTWDQVARGQQIAFAAAKIGAPAGSVDDAVRRYYETLGYGPGYKLPGLSHRTGHGIGMDGHEPVNLVRGETTRLAAGMCFSDEPGVYIPGRYGVRIEDCFHMTDAGPKWFSEPPKSIDAPLG